MIKKSGELRGDFQYSKSINDVADFVIKNFEDYNTSYPFHTALKYFPLELSTENGDISFLINCGCASDKIDINSLVDSNGSINNKYYDLFISIFENSGINDSVFLADMFIDAMDLDTNERDYESEIALKNPLFTQGYIYDPNKIEEILRIYSILKNDEEGIAFEWERYFNYGISKNIDYNCMDEELTRLFFGSTATKDETIIYENIEDLRLSDEADKEILSRFNINFYTPILKCNVGVSHLNDLSSYSFILDLNKKKVSFFEKN